jgi:EAL domain-containing protein (putative c-di-GMP-specific phosphodiesterase class I)
MTGLVRRTSISASRRSELQALTTMRCDVGQGFLFAPPMPQDRLIALIHELTQKVALA